MLPIPIPIRMGDYRSCWLAVTEMDCLCMAMRYLPLWLLLAAHCRGSDGWHWPTDAECMARVLRYGFSVELLPDRPLSPLTHLFVHISSQHFANNAVACAVVLAEFGQPAEGPPSAEPSNRLSTSNLAAARRQRLQQQQLLLLKALCDGIAATAVLTIGGVVGGLGGQLLYNDSTVAIRRDRAARIAAAAAALSSTAGAASPSVNGEFGAGLLWSQMRRHATAMRQQAEAWNGQLAASVQAAVNDSMMVCGASAGICAISGFNAVYFRRPVSMLFLVLPEVVNVTKDLWQLGYHSWLRGSSSGNGSGGAAAKHAWTSLWRSMAIGEPVVGRAAHVGGCIAGAALGYLCLSLKRWRRQRQRQRETAGGRPAGAWSSPQNK